MSARRAGMALLWAALALGVGAVPPLAAAPTAAEQAELEAARELFERNLDAIRRRDTDAYLSCYRRSEQLARTGPGGVALGYDVLAKSAGQGWPDLFDAQDLNLVPITPGVVYGTYRYRVAYGADEQTGRSERWFVKTPEGWKIAVSTAFPAPPGTPPPGRALVGGTLVDGTGGAPVADAVVVLEGGKIECAGTRAACPVPDGIATFDARGHWLVPGLVDAHVHFSQSGWVDARPDAVDLRAQHSYETVVAELAAKPERFARSLLCSGVTAAFDVGGFPWTLKLPARFEANTRAPHFAAAGPLLTTIDHWLNLPGERQMLYLADPESARAGVRYLKSAGAAAAKIWWIVGPDSRAPAELEALGAVVAAEAKAAGLPVIVHATGLAEAKSALRLGAKVLVHSVDDHPVDEEFLELLRSSGAIYTPTLTVAGGYLRAFEAMVAGKTPAVDDPNGCAAPELVARLAEAATVGAGEFTAARIVAFRRRLDEQARTSADNLRRIAEAGLPIALGTDAGNPLTLHGPSIYAEAEAMQAAGMPAMAVLVAATRGGARAMGREAELGTLEAGKAADLLLLDADPTVDIAALRRLRYVVRGGELRGIAELRPAPPAPKE